MVATITRHAGLVALPISQVVTHNAGLVARVENVTQDPRKFIKIALKIAKKSLIISFVHWWLITPLFTIIKGPNILIFVSSN